MTDREKNQRNGSVGVVTVLSGFALALGVGLDLLSAQAGRFWIGANVGGAAAIGAAAALVVFLAVRAWEWLGARGRGDADA
jgi:hypothetical protein